MNQNRTKKISLQTWIFLIGTIISVLIFLGEAHFVEYMQSIGAAGVNFLAQVQYAIGMVGRDMKYRGIFWGVFVPFIVPMVVTILLTALAGKLQKKTSAAEEAHQAAQRAAQQQAQQQAAQRAEELRKTQAEAAKTQEKLGAAAALKTYKELLDAGVLTPEEFEAKKQELLNL